MLKNEQVKKTLIIFIVILIIAFMFQFFHGRKMTSPTVFDQFPESEDGMYFFEYAYLPFYKETAKPDWEDSEKHVYSAPMALGANEGLVRVKITGIELPENIQVRPLFYFKDIEEQSDSWIEIFLKDGVFEFNKAIKSPFAQLRLTSGDELNFNKTVVRLTVKAERPLGVPGLLWYRGDFIQERTERFTVNDYHKEVDYPLLVDRPMKTVPLKIDFDSYRTVSIVNGHGANVIGLLDMDETDENELEDIVFAFRDQVKLWKISGFEKESREQVSDLVNTIYSLSKGSVILWNGARPQSTGKGDAPVDLNRGILWTVIVIFMFGFLIYGTVKIFSLELSFKPERLVHELKPLSVLILLMTFPVIPLKLKYPGMMDIISGLVFWFLFVTGIEFLRGIIIRYLKDSVKKYDSIKNPMVIDTLSVVLSSLLFAFLFAGYPDVATATVILLVLTNFISGCYFGKLHLDGQTIGFIAFVHFIVIFPMAVLMGI